MVLWYGSPDINTDMNGKIYGALVCSSAAISIDMNEGVCGALD